MRKKKEDEVVTSKALCMKCALCDAKIGALIVVDNKLIDGQEVTQFIRRIKCIRFVTDVIKTYIMVIKHNNLRLHKLWNEIIYLLAARIAAGGI